MMAINITSGGTLRPVIYSDSIEGSRDCASSVPNIMPPIMIRIMELVITTVSMSVFLTSRNRFLFKIKAAIKAAKVPMAAASVGVKTPV